MSEFEYDKVLVKDNHILNKKQRLFATIAILSITFVLLIILNITQGIMKEQERLNIIKEDRNANGLSVVVASTIAGITYLFPTSLIISAIIRFFKKIDTMLKTLLEFMPIYVLLFWIPSVWVSNYIANIINIR